jgi:predicted phage gp36 major capsid-like protein
MYNLEELVVIRAALDVLTIQGQSAKKMVNLQDKTDNHIKQLQQGPPKK